MENWAAGREEDVWRASRHADVAPRCLPHRESVSRPSCWELLSPWECTSGGHHPIWVIPRSMLGCGGPGALSTDRPAAGPAVGCVDANPPPARESEIHLPLGLLLVEP